MHLQLHTPQPLQQLQPLELQDIPWSTIQKNNISCPKNYTDGSNYYLLPKALLAEIEHTITKASCYTTIAKSPKWCDAMYKEFDALFKKGTWSLVLFLQPKM